MPTPVEALQASLGQLQADYRARLRDQAEKLERFQSALRSVQPNPALLQGIQFIAHSIHGSGKIFGFAEVSAAAGLVEEWLYERVNLEKPRLSAEEAETLGRLLDRLVKTCREEKIMEEATSPLFEPFTEVHADFTVFLATPDGRLHQVFQSLLPPEGIEVETAASGRQLLDLLDQQTPDLIVLDTALPDSDCKKILKTIRQQLVYASIPVVFLADTTPRHMSREQVERHHHITKPIKGDTLLACIRMIRGKLSQRILLIDDDPLVLKLLRHRFEQRGFEVITAVNGEEGLAHLQEKPPALVILDRTMPGMEGLTVLEHIRSSPPHQRIPVILLTARHEKQDILDGLEGGADDYMVKPFVPEELMIRSFRLLGLLKELES